MVIAHDHINAGRSERTHCRVGVGPTVGGHHDACAGRDGGRDPGGGEVVAILEATWHEGDHASAECLNGARRSAVDAIPSTS